ncbi:MAG: hypothetical protein GF308_07015 [Candidatus Heimdallarchaeota archaeon]|nr:hypothetical protein [Candidatus Heimdallarchaeota archaeon]
MKKLLEKYIDSPNNEIQIILSKFKKRFMRFVFESNKDENAIVEAMTALVMTFNYCADKEKEEILAIISSLSKEKDKPKIQNTAIQLLPKLLKDSSIKPSTGHTININEDPIIIKDKEVISVAPIRKTDLKKRYSYFKEKKLIFKRGVFFRDFLAMVFLFRKKLRVFVKSEKIKDHIFLICMNEGHPNYKYGLIFVRADTWHHEVKIKLEKIEEFAQEITNDDDSQVKDLIKDVSKSKCGLFTAIYGFLNNPDNQEIRTIIGNQKIGIIQDKYLIDFFISNSSTFDFIDNCLCFTDN